MSFSPQTALEFLIRAQDQNRLAHAYLISGPPGSGKLDLASRLAAHLNHSETGAVLRGVTPGISITEPASRSRRIVVDQIRALERVLQLQAPNGEKKIGIIRDADRMQPQAANAFLKTLEEPPQNSLLLLLTGLPDALPDTIVSRCLHLPLRAPSEVQPSPEESALRQLLDATATDSSPPITRAYRISQGLQRLLETVREGIRDEHEAALKDEEQRYRTRTDGAWLDQRSDHYKSLTESIYRERRSRLLETLFLWWADLLRAKVSLAVRHLPESTSATAAAAEHFSVSEVLRRIRRLEEMRDQLNTTAQEALVLEVACLAVFG